MTESCTTRKWTLNKRGEWIGKKKKNWLTADGRVKDKMYMYREKDDRDESNTRKLKRLIIKDARAKWINQWIKHDTRRVVVVVVVGAGVVFGVNEGGRLGPERWRFSFVTQMAEHFASLTSPSYFLAVLYMYSILSFSVSWHFYYSRWTNSYLHDKFLWAPFTVSCELQKLEYSWILWDKKIWNKFDCTAEKYCTWQ